MLNVVERAQKRYAERKAKKGERKRIHDIKEERRQVERAAWLEKFHLNSAKRR